MFETLSHQCTSDQNTTPLLAQVYVSPSQTAAFQMPLPRREKIIWSVFVTFRRTYIVHVPFRYTGVHVRGCVYMQLCVCVDN